MQNAIQTGWLPFYNFNTVIFKENILEMDFSWVICENKVSELIAKRGANNE